MIRVSVREDMTAAGGFAEVLPVAAPEDLGKLPGRKLSGTGDLLLAVAPSAGEELLRETERFAAFLNFFLRSLGELSKELEEYNAGLTDGDCRPQVGESLAEFARMNGGGKCIRGTLAKLGYSLFSGRTDTAYADGLAQAFEIIQTSILIHDDIIDHASLRRNKTTIPYSYLARWRAAGKELPPAEAMDTANSMALCAGDLGIFLSLRVLLRAYREDSRLPRLMDYFNTAILNTIQGEIIDVALPFEEKHGLSRESDLYQSIIDIFRLKTSWYTVTGPLCAGALLAGCGERELGALEEFCEAVGVAFQIKDDIMGLFSREAALGKDVGSDAAEFKQTLFYYFMRTREALYPRLLEYYGRPLRREELAALQDLLRDCGALAYAEGEMQRCFQRARDLLEGVEFLPEEKKDLLYGLLTFLRYRDK